jgi:short-subunit dehydrogenase
MRAALVVPTDLSANGQAASMVKQTLQHFGRLDVLINNAGVAAPTNSDSLDPETTRRVLETNLVGAMIATREALPSMLRQGYGHIINVCSPAGFLGVPLMADYCASKAAMSGWTRALQAEWLGTEVNVTEYLPGLIDTELGQSRDETVASPSRASDSGTGPLAALSPDRVADQLVACVRRPRQVMYSSFGARMMCWVMESARFRRAVGSRIGIAQRKQLGLPVFTIGRDD